MEKISFKIAKALKEAGYPQDNCLELYLEDGSYLYTGGILLTNRVYYKIDSYLEVWLWLWREKGLRLSVEYVRASETEYESWCLLNQEHIRDTVVSNGDPEEAIITAIEHLVNNDLIK